MSLPNVPVVNAGLMYVNGLQISYSGGTKVISIASGQARDSSNSNDILLSAPVTVNGGFVGPGAVDAAPIVASSLYAVYVIASSDSFFTSNVELGGGPLSPPVPPNPYPTVGLLSLNYSQPALPLGYDMYRRVGWVFTDSSANVIQMWQYGNGNEKRFYWDVPQIAFSTSVGPVPAPTTFTSIPLASATSPNPLIVPPITTDVLFEVIYTPTTASSNLSFRPYGSSSSNGDVQFGCGSSIIQYGSLRVPSELNGSNIPTIQFKSIAGTDGVVLSVTGFWDSL